MNIDNTPSINHVVTQVTTYIENAQWNKALITIREFVEAIVRNPFCNGIILCVPALDNLCQAIGNAIPHEASSNRDEDTILYIASQLYLAGGHTAVIEDAIRAQPNKKHHLLITNIYNSFFKNKIIKRFENLPVKLHWADSWTMYGKFSWLRKTWISLNPASVYLFNHHQDAAIIAAATPTMPGDIYYYHHIDFQLGLGKSLAHTIHIDMNPLAFAECQQHNHQQHIYSPLTCHDYGYRNMNAETFMKNQSLTTASSGSLKKFTSPYRYSYADIIPTLLKSTRGTHFHIGPLDQCTLASIHEGMRKQAISFDKFQHIEFTSNLWKTLLDNEVDLFITSFPIGGGRTAIEVMGAGIPIIGHINAQSAYLSEVALLSPDAPIWKTPDELTALLANMNPAALAEIAKKGRAHYEAFYLNQPPDNQHGGSFINRIPPALNPQTIKSISSSAQDTEQLIEMSEFIANGDNIEGRAVPRILFSCLRRLLPYQLIMTLTQLTAKNRAAHARQGDNQCG